MFLATQAKAHTLIMSVVPNPSPSSPSPEATSFVRRLLSTGKWVGLVAAVLLVVGLGAMAVGAKRGGHGSRAAEMQEQIGSAVMIAAAVVAGPSVLLFLAGF